MKKRFSVLVSTAVFAFGVAAFSLAEEEATEPEVLELEAPDAAGSSGRRDRPHPHMVKSFQRMDKDGDGKMSFDEFIADQTKRLKRVYDMRDHDGDGVVTEEEWLTRLGRRRPAGARPAKRRSNSPPN